jgi:hypothetical protein
MCGVVRVLIGAAVLCAGCLRQVAQLNPFDAGPDVAFECDGGPWVTVSPAAVEFGSVVGLTTAMKVVRVSNCATEDVQLKPSLGGLQGQLFGVEPPPGVEFTVPASQSVALRVTYSPADAPTSGGGTPDTATLILATRVGGTLPIPLQGTALPSGLVWGTPDGGEIYYSGSGLDFGAVPVGGSKTLTARATNTGPVTISIPPFSIVNFESPPGFTIADESWPGGELAPGESRVVKVTYTPPAKNTIYLSVLVPGSVWSDDLLLLGLVGTPSFSCVPTPLDFGWVALNGKAILQLTCVNTGWAEEILDFSTDHPAFSAVVDPASPNPASAAQPLERSQSVLIDVVYAPVVTNNDVATLTIGDNWQQTSAVALAGVAFSRDLGPCSLSLDPPNWEFPLLQVGETSTESFILTNVGLFECLVDAFDISSDCPSSFSIPAGVASQRLATQGGNSYSDALTIPVSFTPVDAGNNACDFTVDIDAGQPPIDVWIGGHGYVVH